MFALTPSYPGRVRTFERVAMFNRPAGKFDLLRGHYRLIGPHPLVLVFPQKYAVTVMNPHCSFDIAATCAVD